MANDFGHEPWARAAVERGDKLTPEQGAELLKSLDKARGELRIMEARLFVMTKERDAARTAQRDAMRNMLAMRRAAQ